MEKQDMFVGGDKVTSIDKKVGKDGYFTDKWGNKIYATGNKPVEEPAKESAEEPTTNKPEDKVDSVSEAEGTEESAEEAS